jgi:hypothetical protein
MILYPNGLIGYNPYNKTEVFSGSDSEELFKKNLETKPLDWYYRNVKITYERNSYGHRCKNASDINYDNYILFVGCSHTEGVGLELEHTYPYTLSKKLNCDYYNLALGGSGIDVAIHNLTVWLNTHKKPKYIVFQWPYWIRAASIAFNQYKDVKIIERLEMFSLHSNSEIVNFMIAGNELKYFEAAAYLAKYKVKSYNIPVFHVSAANVENEKDFFDSNDQVVKFIRKDFARDEHFGIESNNDLMIDLYNKIKNYRIIPEQNFLNITRALKRN